MRGDEFGFEDRGVRVGGEAFEEGADFDDGAGDVDAVAVGLLVVVCFAHGVWVP